eukprot:390212_1
MSDQRLTILHDIDAQIDHCRNKLFKIQDELNGLSAPNQDSHYGRVISDTYGRLMQERKIILKEIKNFQKTKEFIKTLSVAEMNLISKNQQTLKGYDQQEGLKLLQSIHNLKKEQMHKLGKIEYKINALASSYDKLKIEKRQILKRIMELHDTYELIKESNERFSYHWREQTIFHHMERLKLKLDHEYEPPSKQEQQYWKNGQHFWTLNIDFGPRNDQLFKTFRGSTYSKILL